MSCSHASLCSFGAVEGIGAALSSKTDANKSDAKASLDSVAVSLVESVLRISFKRSNAGLGHEMQAQRRGVLGLRCELRCSRLASYRRPSKSSSYGCGIGWSGTLYSAI